MCKSGWSHLLIHIGVFAIERANGSLLLLLDVIWANMRWLRPITATTPTLYNNHRDRCVEKLRGPRHSIDSIQPFECSSAELNISGVVASAATAAALAAVYCSPSAFSRTDPSRRLASPRTAVKITILPLYIHKYRRIFYLTGSCIKAILYSILYSKRPFSPMRNQWLHYNVMQPRP